MDVRETGVRGSKGTEGSFDMPVNLCALALQTCACPLASVLIDPRPNLASCDQFLRSVAAGMGQAMDGFKYGTPMAFRDEWSR